MFMNDSIATVTLSQMIIVRSQTAVYDEQSIVSWCWWSGVSVENWFLHIYRKLNGTRVPYEVNYVKAAFNCIKCKQAIYWKWHKSAMWNLNIYYGN